MAAQLFADYPPYCEDYRLLIIGDFSLIPKKTLTIDLKGAHTLLPLNGLVQEIDVINAVDPALSLIYIYIYSFRA